MGATASNNIHIMQPDLPVVAVNEHGGQMEFSVVHQGHRTYALLSMMDATYLRRLAQTIDSLADQMDDTSVCTCQEVGA